MSKDIVSFVNKYAIEALAVAEALNSILGGLALSPAQKDIVQHAIDTMQAAAENISNSKATYSVTINASDIEKAVKAYLDKSLNNTVGAAVDAKLADLPERINSAVQSAIVTAALVGANK